MRSESDPIQNDPRRAGQRLRIPKGTVFPLCRCYRPEALQLVRDPELVRITLELHHVVGRHHDPKFGIWLCATCHWIITEIYRLKGISMKASTDFTARVATMLRGLSAF